MIKSDANSSCDAIKVSDGDWDLGAKGVPTGPNTPVVQPEASAGERDADDLDADFTKDLDGTQVKQNEEVNSITVLHHQFVDAVTRIGRCHKYSPSSREPHCLCICGESGTGKTTVKEYYASRYPRIDEGSVTKVPILHVIIPEGPSPKSLVETLLRSLGDPAFDKGNTVTKTHRLYLLLKRCCVECIMLDEFQHFVEPNRPRLMYEVADWLKNLIENTKIPVVLFGLDRCLAVFEQNGQLARRFSNRIFLRPFDWDNQKSQLEFRAFLGAVRNRLPFSRVPDLAARNLAYRLFVASAGYVGYLMKIVRGAATYAIDERRQEITVADIERAYVTEIWDATIQPVNPFAADFDVDAFMRDKMHRNLRNRFKGDKADQSRARQALRNSRR